MTPKGYPYYYRDKFYIAEKKIDAAICDYFQSIKLTNEGIDKMRQGIRTYLDSFHENRKDERTAAMRQLDQLDCRLKTAEDKLLDGVLDDMRYTQIKMRLNSEREIILRNFPENQMPKDNELEPVFFVLKTLKNMGKIYPRLQKEAKREIVRLFILELVCDEENISIQAKPEVQALLAPLKMPTGAPTEDNLLTILENVGWYKKIKNNLKSVLW